MDRNRTGTHFSVEVKKTSCSILTKQSKISQHDKKSFLSEKSLKQVIIARDLTVHEDQSSLLVQRPNDNLGREDYAPVI